MIRKLSRLFPLITVSIFLSFSALSYGQNWSGILSPDRAIDWSHAGVSGGIQARTTVCTTLNPGATTAQINSAISACPSGQTVFLNAGTYNLTGGIAFTGKSNVTLRGAGADQTLLVFSGGGGGCHGFWADVCLDSADTNWVGGPSNSANWTAGYAKGTTTITLSSVTGLKVGFPLVLDQADDASDTGTKFVCQATSTSPPCSLEGNGNNGARNNRDQEQIVQVVSCGTSTPGAACTSTSVTITPGIYDENWNSSKSPGAWWATTPITADGLENLSVDNTASTGARGVEVFNCIDCWVKGTRGIKSGRSHVEVLTSARVTVRDNYFYNTQNAVSQSYGVSPYGSTDLLVENNIFQYITTPLQINGCTGCVIGYNYTINNYYEGSAGYVMPSFMAHTAGDDLILIEGNIGPQTHADVFHGTHNLLTYFRNYFAGNQAVCWNGTGHDNFEACNAHQIAVEFLSYNREFNVVGNVLGSSAQKNYLGVVNTVYALGNGNTEGSVTVGADPLVSQTLMRWGNWDTVNNSTLWNSSDVPTGLSQYAAIMPSSQVLPNSFYMLAKPSWWPSGKPWPLIGPDVTGGTIAGTGGHASSLPAQDCFLNVMKGPADGTGPVLNFNAANCYGGSVGSNPPPNPPNPPTGLNATVS